MAIRIFRHYWQLHFALLALADFLFFLGAQFAILNYFQHVSGVALDITSTPVVASVLFACLVFLAMAAMGLYSARQRARLSGVTMRVLLAVLAGTVLFVVIGNLLLPGWVTLPEQLCAAIFAGVGAVGIHMLMEMAAGDDLLKRKVLVYGAGQRANSITRLRRRSDQRGFVIVGYVPADGDQPIPEMTALLLDPMTSLREHCRGLAVDEVVVAMDDRRRQFPMGELLDCRLDGIEVIELVTFLERETGKLRLDLLNPSWMIFSEGFRRGRVHFVLERSLDVIASLVLVTLTLPIMLLTLLAIKIEDGFSAAIFYRQKRVGQYGHIFELLKFRSMREDAEGDGRPQWASKNDARVTKVGSFIRKTRIDELPQVLNVLRGEMSFVGPRPERPEFVSQLNERIPYYRERHTVKPGITGWAQLCYPYGSSEQDAMEKLQYDLYYVKNHSLLFYMAALIQTVEVIIWRKGAR